MQWLIVTVLLWRPFLSIGGSIGVYPSSQYFGGDKTQPTITCKPSEACGDTIKWFFGQNEVDTTDTSKYSTSLNFKNYYQTLTIINANEGDVGFYHCQCTFSGTATNSPNSELKHTDPVSFDNSDNTIYHRSVGANVTLICEIVDYVEFQWQFPNKTVVPSNTNKYQYQGTNLFIDDLSVSDNMTYYCAGNNQITNINKLSALVIIYKQPNVVVNGETSVMIDEGDSVTFSCTADGYPQPSIIWSRSGAVLNIGGRITKQEVEIDDYTKKSSLIINHVSSSDEGQYLCTGQSSSLDKFATAAQTFSLVVIEPPGPLFQIFTIDSSHNSINISWILSGVPSADSINVSWNSAAEGDQQRIYFSNSSSVVIEGLLPNTHYIISAKVIGTQLTDSVNKSTDPLVVSSTTQSTSIVMSSVSMNLPSQMTSSILVSTSTKPSRPHSTTKEQLRTSTMQDKRMSSTPVRPQATVEDLSARNSSLATALPVAVLLVIVLTGVIIITLVCVIKRGRQSKVKNIQSIERANSSRSDQLLLDNNSSSFVSINSEFHSCSPSITKQSYAGSDFDCLKMHPSDLYHHSGNTSNHSSHTKLPLSSANGNDSIHFTMQDEPFQMTDNPVNAEYESSQQLAMPPISYSDFIEDTRMFPPGDSVSQVIFTSQSQNTFETYHTQEENNVFDYTPNLCYEEIPPFKGDIKSQSESCNRLPLYENRSADQPRSPKFGIVDNGQRGAVREQVEIKKR